MIANQVIATPEVIKNIESIIEYLESSEADHYKETVEEEGEAADHVYLKAGKIREWLNSITNEQDNAVNNERNEQPRPFDSYERVRFDLLTDTKREEINNTFDNEVNDKDYVLICDYTGLVIVQQNGISYLTIAGRETEYGTLDDCIQLIRDFV